MSNNGMTELHEESNQLQQPSRRALMTNIGIGAGLLATNVLLHSSSVDAREESISSVKETGIPRVS